MFNIILCSPIKIVRNRIVPNCCKYSNAVYTLVTTWRNRYFFLCQCCIIIYINSLQNKINLISCQNIYFYGGHSHCNLQVLTQTEHNNCTIIYTHCPYGILCLLVFVSYFKHHRVYYKYKYKQFLDSSFIATVKCTKESWPLRIVTVGNGRDLYGNYKKKKTKRQCVHFMYLEII